MKLAAIAVLALLCMPAWSQGTAELSWTPPTRFTNGDPLDPATDLSGYGVYADGARIDVADNEVSTYVVGDLGYGEHEFFVTAIAVNGNESAMSNVAVQTIVDDRVPEPPTLLDVIIAFLLRVWEWFA